MFNSAIDQYVAKWVAEHRQPRVISLDPSTHIFMFSADEDWTDEPILFVNKNGHHFRVLNETGTAAEYVKTWNGVSEAKDWQRPGLKRSNVEDLLPLAGDGPQGRESFESLCLLPREANTGKRLAAWRCFLLPVSFDRNTDSFTLRHPYDNLASETFKGKLWLSKEASDCAAGWLKDYAMPIVKPVSAPLAPEVMTAQLENHALYGMFG